MSTTVPAVTESTDARVGIRGWVALAVLMLPVLLVSVDNTVLNFALPAVSEDLTPTGAQLLWMIDIYPLVLAGLLVSMGSLGDRIGRRKLLLIGSAGFGVVSVVAAFASSIELLITARAILGFFGAMLMPSTLSLLRNIFQDRNQRRLAVAVWASGFAAGSALGPIIGGVLLEHLWWGSVFLIAVPFLAPLLILSPFLVPESRDPHPGRLDVVSIGLSLVTMFPLVYGIKHAATEGIDVLSILCILIAVASGVAFVRRQFRVETPMIDMALFRIPQFSGAIVVNLFSVIALVGGLFFVTQHLQLVLALSPLTAGFTLLPGLVTMIVAGLVVVPIAARVRPSIVVPVALLFSAGGYGAIALTGGDVSAFGIGACFVALGLGIGAAETVSNELVLAHAPAAKAGAASAVSETAYELGAVLGTAILGTILTASYRNAVAVPDGLTAEQSHAASETLGGAVSVAGQLPASAGDTLLESARVAFDSGVGLAAWVGFGLIVAAGIVALVSLRHVPEGVKTAQ
ncbi:MFS transporter [Mycetocola zhujimingii]|uniref:MFS transporter n=1 Tax=Mycetocola zhujimingii TaxID=2079792 RepID=UPI000D3CC04F|nr:MFS transporter [Mycetocola zhujimingii]AWB86803.1 MFS transporter [Mycetocola zhujimingii]